MDDLYRRLLMTDEALNKALRDSLCRMEGSTGGRSFVRVNLPFDSNRPNEPQRIVVSLGRRAT
jgi:hypothetical protein